MVYGPVSAGRAESRGTRQWREFWTEGLSLKTDSTKTADLDALAIRLPVGQVQASRESNDELRRSEWTAAAVARLKDWQAA
jgi:hypothetical protein